MAARSSPRRPTRPNPPRPAASNPPRRRQPLGAARVSQEFAWQRHPGGAADEIARLERVVAELGDGSRGGARRPPARQLTHGFHDYPARLSPLWARRAIAAWARPGGTVLDPFCGSGTVLVEAFAAGHPALGVDLSPLAVRLATLKTRRVGKGRLTRLRKQAQSLAGSVLARAGRSGFRVEIPAALAELPIPTHVLAELVLLHQAIGALDDAQDREALTLVLSSLLVKLSTDSAAGNGRRLGRGLAPRLFADRTGELCDGLLALAERAPAGTAEPRVIAGDARRLLALGIAPGSVDLVLTSPPYAGVYDYVEHHAIRLPWLGLVAGPGADEIGARERFARAGSRSQVERALADYEGGLGEVLAELARVLRKDGAIVWVIADSEAAGRFVDVDALLGPRFAAAGLGVAAHLSQRRPRWAPRAARSPGAEVPREHVYLLRLRPDRQRGAD